MFLEDLFLGLDVQEFVFYEVLRIDASSGLVTGDILHDLLFVLVIPSLVGLMALRSIAGVVLKEHGHLKTLFSIAALGTVVYMGMFTFIAQFSILIFFIWLFVFGGVWGYEKLVPGGIRRKLSEKSKDFGGFIGDGTKSYFKQAKGFSSSSKEALLLEDLIRQAVSGFNAYISLAGSARAARSTNPQGAADDEKQANEQKGYSDAAVTKINAMRYAYNNDSSLISFINSRYRSAVGTATAMSNDQKISLASSIGATWP